MTCVKFCVDCAHVLTMCALASLTMNRICLGKTNQSTLKTKFVTFDLAKIATIPVFQRETDPTQCDNIPLMSPRMLSRGSAIHNNRVQHYNLLLLTFPYLWNFDRRIEDFIIDRIQFKWVFGRYSCKKHWKRVTVIWKWCLSYLLFTEILRVVQYKHCFVVKFFNVHGGRRFIVRQH